jgi:hypothetical protein
MYSVVENEGTVKDKGGMGRNMERKRVEAKEKTPLYGTREEG